MRQGGQHLRRIPIKSFSPNVDFMKALPLAYPSVFPGRVAYHQTRVAIDNGRNKPKTIEENPDLINLKDNGDYLSTDSAKILFRMARDKTGIHFKYHNLRHTHASWLAEHGVPAIVTKKRLGHSKEETTLRYYSHITQGMRNDLLDKLNGVAKEDTETKAS